MAANPPPDLAGWDTIKDPDQRLATALAQLYAYYRATAPMMVNLHRDEAIMPIVKQLFRPSADTSQPLATHSPRKATTGSPSRTGPGRDRPRAFVPRLAFADPRAGTQRPQAADLMCRLAQTAA